MKEVENFKENFIFEKYKTISLISAEIFRKKIKKEYGLSEKQCNNIYAKIIKYQVENYGGSLSGAFSTKEFHNQKKDRRRKYQRIKKRLNNVN